MQELRCREEELRKVMLQQKIQEENLKKREQELAEREIDLLERELSMMMIQQERAAALAAHAAPTPKKRKGKFRKSRLRLLKKDGGHHISMPTGKDQRLLIGCRSANQEPARGDSFDGSAIPPLPTNQETLFGG